MTSQAEKTIYEALEQGPIWGIGLVRDHNLSPARVHRVLRSWHDKGWVTKCDPPENTTEGRNAVWYNLTLSGQQNLRRVFAA